VVGGAAAHKHRLHAQMTLIARRSSEFAGVRFLKRGVNEAGYVGNDVETEQIVADLVATGSAASAPPLAAFVQLRGSIPLFWSQEGNVFEPKPDINICRVDPFYAATARHFASLMRRYGAPLVVLNLIKQQEKRPRESKLSAEFDAAMLYLNSTLPSHAHLQYFLALFVVVVVVVVVCVCVGSDSDRVFACSYISWDWKAAGKRDIKGMIAHMCRLAERSLDMTGFFLSVSRTHCPFQLDDELPVVTENDDALRKGCAKVSQRVCGVAARRRDDANRRTRLDRRRPRQTYRFVPVTHKMFVSQQHDERMAQVRCMRQRAARRRRQPTRHTTSIRCLPPPFRFGIAVCLSMFFVVD
jgi:hypothetical protein